MKKNTIAIIIIVLVIILAGAYLFNSENNRNNNSTNLKIDKNITPNNNTANFTDENITSYYQENSNEKYFSKSNSEYDEENSEEIYELYDGAPHLHSHHNCQIHGYVDNTDFLDNTTNENDSEVQLKPINYFRQVA